MKFSDLFAPLFTTKNLLRVIGLVIFAVILRAVDFTRVVSRVSEASTGYLVAGLLCSLPIMIVRSHRWNLIKQLLHINVPYRFSLYLQFLGQVGFLTPGRVGEFVKVCYLGEQSVSVIRSIASILVDRLFDILIVLVVAGIGVLHLYGNGPGGSVLVVTLVVLLVAIVLIRSPEIFYRTRVQWFLKKILPERFETHLMNLLSSSKQFLRQLGLSDVLYWTVLSLFAFTGQVIRITLFSRSLDISVSPLFLAEIISIVILVNLLPISLMGLGTRDAVFIYFFGLVGVGPERALALSLILFGSVMVYSIVSGLVILTFPPENLGPKESLSWFR